MDTGRLIVRRSALKHGIDAQDAHAVALEPAVGGPLDDEHPQRQLRIGFDTHVRLLEVIVLVWDDGTEEIIHAMKCRPQYRGLLD